MKRGFSEFESSPFLPEENEIPAKMIHINHSLYVLDLLLLLSKDEKKERAEETYTLY